MPVVVGLFERYALGHVSATQLEAETGLAATRIRMILMNPLYNGWVRRHRRSRSEVRKPAPWRADPPVSDELWARVEDVRRTKTRAGGARRADRGSGPRPVALDKARTERQIRDLALEHTAGRLEDAADLERLHELRDAKDNLERTSADGISPERAVAWLRLTPSAYAHGFALALPEKVALARPTGVGRAISTYTIPIEGRDEWLVAAGRLA